MTENNEQSSSTPSGNAPQADTNPGPQNDAPTPAAASTDQPDISPETETDALSPDILEGPYENPLEIPLEIPRKVARKEQRAAKKLLKKADRSKKTLSKRTRFMRSSHFKREAYYSLENMRQGNFLSKFISFFLFVLIVANAVLVFLSVQPNLEPLATNILNAFFLFSTLCFFFEYVARVWVADLVYGNCTSARARLKYAFSALGIIDFLSFAPSMLSWFLPVTPAIIHSVNVLRLIRLVKVTRYMRGFRTMGRVIRKHYQEIVASFLVIFMLIIVASIVMYEVEHDAQPHAFNDLFQGVWFAVETVTTVGYGDIVPITTIGKVCSIIIMVLSMGLIAIPGGIFSAGFVAEFQNANMRRMEREERDVHKEESDRSKNEHSQKDTTKTNKTTSDND